MGGIDVELPNGGTVNADGTITADEVTVNDVTVTGKSVTVDKDGNITVPENGIVKKSETEITLPSGGTVNKDGNIITEKVAAGNTTVTSENEIVFDKDGNIKVSEGDTVQIGDDTTITGSGITISPDGKIILSPDGKVTIERDGKKTIYDAGILKNGDGTVMIGSADGSEIKYIFADDKSECPSDGYIFLSVEEDTSDISEAGTISGYTAIKAYDIKLMYNGEREVQPDGTVKVTLKIPEDVDNNAELEVFHISGETPESMNAVNNDGTISFTTDHFSVYVIASKNSEPPQETDDTASVVPSPSAGLEPAIIGKTDSGTEDASSAAGIAAGNEELDAVKHYSGSAVFVYCIFAAASAAVVLRKKNR